MAKRAGDPPSPGTRKPAGAGTGGAPLAKTVHRQPAGGFESVAGGGGIPACLAELGCDPVAIIASIAMDQGADARLRFSAAKELCAYLLAKPRQSQGEAVGEVDVAAIIAAAWRLPARAKGKGGGAKPAARKRPSPKASGAASGAGR